MPVRAGASGPRPREGAWDRRCRPVVARRAELEQRLLARLAEGPEARALVERLAEEGRAAATGEDAAAPGEVSAKRSSLKARASPAEAASFSRQNGLRAVPSDARA
eukprot:9468737-Pyramimonas_sp.AAC.1